MDEGLGVSVAILLDNSSSMGERAAGDTRPKSEVARAAIERTLDATEAALAKRPDYPVKVGLILFSTTARRARYGAGTFRKAMLVVTDGENNAGARPFDVAHEIHTRSEGGVGMYFVAFDTDPGKFGVLRDVKGDVIAAQNGDALQTSLAELYEGRVLAESAAEPGVPSPAGDSIGGPRRSTSPSIPQ